MKYPFTLDELPGSEFEYEPGFWGNNFYKDGVAVTPSKKEKGKPYIFEDDNGEEVRVYLKSQLLGLDPLPKVKVNDNITLIAEALPWYKCVFASLPLLLLLGGAIGGAIGGFFTYFNFRITRDGSKPIIQYAKMFFLLCSAFALYFMTMLLLLSILNPP